MEMRWSKGEGRIFDFLVSLSSLESSREGKTSLTVIRDGTVT